MNLHRWIASILFAMMLAACGGNATEDEHGQAEGGEEGGEHAEEATKGTHGGRLLQQGGFSFPWADEVLIISSAPEVKRGEAMGGIVGNIGSCDHCDLVVAIDGCTHGTLVLDTTDLAEDILHEVTRTKVQHIGAFELVEGGFHVVQALHHASAFGQVGSD